MNDKRICTNDAVVFESDALGGAKQLMVQGQLPSQLVTPTRKRDLLCGTSFRRQHCRFGDEQVEGIAKSASLARRANERAACSALNS
jgi:hypothetical protein